MVSDAYTVNLGLQARHVGEVGGVTWGGGVGVLGLIAGYVPLVWQSPYPIIVYSVTNYRPHFSHFWAIMSLSIYVSTL